MIRYFSVTFRDMQIEGDKLLIRFWQSLNLTPVTYKTNHRDDES